MNFASLSAVIALAATVSAKVYFEETFPKNVEFGGPESQWSLPEEQYLAIGKFSMASGEFHGDEDEALGLKTTEDSQFYAAYAKFDEPLDTCNKTVVLQFSVKNEHTLNCGGTYLKLSDVATDMTSYSGDTSFKILFGPDVCGPSRRIFLMMEGAEGKLATLSRNIEYPKDKFTHFYTLVLNNPEMTYQILIDGKVAAKGNLIDDMAKWSDEPRMIPDAEAEKPADWDERQMIDDPEDTKSDTYDIEIPPFIDDSSVEQPADWDEDKNGPWTAPQIKNPEWVEWTPRQIANPAYRGQWRARLIPNPKFDAVAKQVCYKSIDKVALDVWQVESGSLFDNILVTDSVQEAEEHRLKHFETEFKAKEREAFNVYMASAISKSVNDVNASNADNAVEIGHEEAADDGNSTPSPSDSDTTSGSGSDNENEHFEL
jgi:calreticulin